MLDRYVVADNSRFLRILTYNDIRSFGFTLIFVVLSVSTPFALHHIRLAGPTFLPMHVFILLAGLLFGWKAGLIVGALSPIVSYLISGMPVQSILPQVIIEVAVYGTTAGLLREKCNLRTLWALIGAMVAGRIALLFAIMVFSYIGNIYSTTGIETNALNATWSTIRQSWPGILIQIISIPLILKLLSSGEKTSAR